MSKIILSVSRGSVSEETTSYTTYELSIPSTTLLMALRYIKDHLDPSLDFRLYHCAQGICSSCLMLLNNQLVKACETIVEPGRSYKVDPPPGGITGRDLFVYADEQPLFD